MKRSTIELRHLQTLVTLYETGSVSRAAQGLYLTQSALSHQIKMLEDFFELPLFVRKSSPLIFTPAGQYLLTLAEKILPLIKTAERDIARLRDGTHGTLRIAVECHTCFDWLMPAMDEFRMHWPEVELDIVSGFHTDPVGLLHQNKADLAIVSECEEDKRIQFSPLFRFQIVAILANEHPLNDREYLRPSDFLKDTLITYPVPDDMLDVMRKVLIPAGVAPLRRTSELTVAILQLVASRRGIATLPLWAVSSYLERNYVMAKQITRKGLVGELYAATNMRTANGSTANAHNASATTKPYLLDFIETIREMSLSKLPGITLL